MFFQPQVHLGDSRLVGAEALIRWRHPVRGLISPGEFMSVVNTSGISDRIADWVLQTACRQARAWEIAGHPLRVGINLSPSQLQSGETGEVFRPHQGLQLLEDESADEVLDGYLVNASHSSRRSVEGEPIRSAASRTQVVAGLTLALQLTSGNRRPRLAALNIYHSAARTAALSVAKGVDAAIGFQDAFDDQLAELFFATFYRAWRLSEWNTVAAFQHA